jgi:hypothetical protein
LKKEPHNPKLGPTRRHDDGAHPVLARLPDVANQPLPQPRAASAAAAGFVDYRFDMPAGAEEVEAPRRLRVQPPAFKRSPHSERRSRPFGGSSRVLPASNPFEFSATSTLDRLAPVARFLTLFLLFTAIGTFVLSTTREHSSEPKHEHAPSAAAPTEVEQRLEPTSTTDHPTIASPKAFGPLGANSSKPADDAGDLLDFATQSETQSTEVRPEGPPSLAGANGEPLPQVQTTEVKAANRAPSAAEAGTARFTGSIQAVDAAPSTAPAKPPSVARLPAIFEAPRHAYQ